MRRVYELVDPRTGKVRYIGSTANILIRRLEDHIREILFHYTKRELPRRTWVLELFSQGYCPLIREISIHSDNAEALITKRRKIQEALDSGVDLLNIMGRPRAEEWRQRTSAALRGRPGPTRGKPLSAAHRAAIKEGLRKYHQKLAGG